MKTFFMIYFGANVLLFFIACLLLVTAGRLGMDLNSILRNKKEKTLQELMSLYIILLLVNLFMYLLSTNL